MEHLWAPWRMEYIDADRESGCIFCKKAAADDDEANLILHRGESCFVILNLFPYNPGHLLIAPYRHTAELSGLTPEESAEMFVLTQRSIDILKETMSPEGFNIGMNLGKTAGAGIADHLHMHAVPRWDGDTNFMPVLGDVKVLPEHLNATWKKLSDFF